MSNNLFDCYDDNSESDVHDDVSGTKILGRYSYDITKILVEEIEKLQKMEGADSSQQEINFEVENFPMSKINKAIRATREILKAKKLTYPWLRKTTRISDDDTGVTIEHQRRATNMILVSLVRKKVDDQF